MISQGKAVEAPRLIGYLDDRDSASLVSELLTTDDGFPQKDTQEILNDCIVRIKKQRLNSKCQILQRQIKVAQQQGDQEQLDRLVAEFRDLQRLRIP